MHPTTFADFRDQHYGLIVDINESKGKDYAGDADALANFKDAAEGLGITPEQVWAVYAHKHWSAVMSFVRNGDTASEPIEGRIHDLILYGFLLLGLIEDARAERLAFQRGEPNVGDDDPTHLTDGRMK